MRGARFVRADLHVHTFPDDPADPPFTVEAVVQAALAHGLHVLGITDHNTCRNVRTAIAEAAGSDLLVLPGIEISTHEGHLLGLFDPDCVETLEEFSTTGNLQLQADASTGALHSYRSMLDLVGEIADRGGLAIAAHVDAGDGIGTRLNSVAMGHLLGHEGLAGLEFVRHENLGTWFSADDSEGSRRAAWGLRQANTRLAERGIARIMSSDAHSPVQVGKDRANRTLVRLRVDDLTFAAVKAAILFSPNARCKAEVPLPASYPRILSASFEGGFLDGVALSVSDNLTCVIGGRGSGKSTALIAVRAALGAELSPDEDPDDPERMPDITRIAFIDQLGSERVAIRRRGEAPEDEASGGPIFLPLADLGQDESGRLARGYEAAPEAILEFLDKFVDLDSLLAEERRLLAELEDNAAEVMRTNKGLQELPELERTVKRMDATLTAAQKGKVEAIAEWASILTTQGTLRTRLSEELAKVTAVEAGTLQIDVDSLAEEAGADLSRGPAKDFVSGADGLREELAQLVQRRQRDHDALRSGLQAAAEGATEVLNRWKERHDELQQRLDARRKELSDQGLRVETGAVLALAKQLDASRTRLNSLLQRQTEHREALSLRRQLLSRLDGVRDQIFQRRRGTLRRVIESANAASTGLRIHVALTQAGMRGDWARWLGTNCRFRSPRVQRLAAAVTPREFATALHSGRDALAALRADGEGLFDATQLDEVFSTLFKWDTIFELETWRLEDRARIEVQEPGSPARRSFDHLSAGQQRSVLLGLLLCAERDEPLVIDQPEDHLDAEYIAQAIVGHLEAVKERRQVLLATHSANLTVLGDAELVIPMHAEGRHGEPRGSGSVDRAETRDRVCQLLEGGKEAYRRRGERYGFDFRPPAVT